MDSSRLVMSSCIINASDAKENDTLMSDALLILEAEAQEIVINNETGNAKPPAVSVHEKSGRRKSEIWNHFVKVNHSSGAKCYYCGHILSFAAGSLSNLLRHLRKKHQKIAATFRYNNHRRYNNFMNSSTEEVQRTAVEAVQEPLVRESSPFTEPVTVWVKSENCEDSRNEKGVKRKQQKMDEHTEMSCKSIETSFKRDHSYGERPPLVVEELFGQFIQAELSRFKNEMIRRKCKREILRVLMKHQEIEDENN